MTLSVSLLATPMRYDHRRRWLGGRSYWLCQACGWGGVFLLMFGPLPFAARASGAEIAALLFFTATGIGLSHLLRVGIIAALDHAHTWSGLLLRLIPRLMAIAIAHVTAQIVWAHSVCPHEAAFMTTRPGVDPVLLTFADTFSLSAGLFIVWAGAYFALRIYRQYQAARIERLELAAHVQEAAWQALRAQLNPHLLFNSLNSIRALIPKDLAAPREALTHLSDLLRSSLSLKQDELIPLHREMETVDSFLALERLRFEQRLRITRTIDHKAKLWMVPPFLVQILVENAVKYGVAPFEEGGDIELRIAIESDHLRVEVINRGQIGLPTHPTSTGLGLANVRSRLALLFGPAATLTVANSGPDHVSAQALVPARPALVSPSSTLTL